MPATDTIADMLTRIRNALIAKHGDTKVLLSKINLEIARVLKEQGYIVDYEVTPDGNFEVIKIKLKYTDDKKSAINGIKRISKPGLRVYAKKDQVIRVLGGLGIAIISTSKGVITDYEARKLKLGGEVIAYVW